MIDVLEVNTTPEETQERVITVRAERKGRRAVEKRFKTLEALKVVYVPVEQLCANDWNPNRQADHDFELLCRSMEEDGFTQPIIALSTMFDGKFMIVDGEHRWRAAMTLGLKEIPVVLVDMTPEQARISTVRHNRARGSHDLELDAELLRDLRQLGALDWAQDSLMLDDVELNRMLTDYTAATAMSADVFSEAWVPEMFTQEETELIREGMETLEAREHVGSDGAVASVAMTAAAVERQRERERLLARAKTEQERQAVRQDMQIYRISLVFSGEEAEAVKQVLGNRPAEMLLEMCRAQVLVGA